MLFWPSAGRNFVDYQQCSNPIDYINWIQVSAHEHHAHIIWTNDK